MSVLERVERILRRVAEVAGIRNCEITPNSEAISGDGFLSEFYTGIIKNKDTGDLLQIYIKVKPPRGSKILAPAFINEVNFYAEILPELDQFQKSQGVQEPFDKIPKFFCGSLEEGQEYLALVDLKALDYVLVDKSQFIDEKHLKLIFATYGKYHALTFAYKASNPEKYQTLIKPIQDVFGMFKEHEEVTRGMIERINLCYDHIKATHPETAAKIQLLIDDFPQAVNKGFDYDGKFSTLVHGDCWSNNILFKYQVSSAADPYLLLQALLLQPNGELEDLRLLDHQLLRDTTPVHDLSYFFYSGASKVDFDKLDEYLEIYYRSFSSFAKELGFDPNDLLPFEALKSDWKNFAFLGVYMGILLWEVKFMSKKEIQELGGASTDENDMHERFLKYAKAIRQHPEFVRNISNILIHAVEYGII